MKIAAFVAMVVGLAACGQAAPRPLEGWDGTQWVPIVCKPGPTVLIDGLVYGGSICADEGEL